MSRPELRTRRGTRSDSGQTKEALRERVKALETEVRQLRRRLGISERARARSEKLHALGQLISGVAHELANPLTAIVACASFASSAKTLEDARRHAATVEEQGQRATRIVQALSSFARRRAATRAPVCLNDVVRAVIDHHGVQLTASDVDLIEDLENDLPPVDGDPYELEQVVLNLVVNAHHAMVHAHGRGRLTIRTRSTDTTVRLMVEDDGPGIPRTVMTRIFEAFYTTKGENGTGLGLAIARDLVNRHRGRIWATSDASAGTTMTIELPRLGDHSVRPVPTPTDGHRPVAPRTILVVDDEPEFGELLAELLCRRGYETEYVESAAAALRRLRERDFDIILTDLRMPRMSGEDFWQTLRRQHPALAKRTVFMTGYYAACETAAIVAALEQPCLTKPFRASELDELLASLERTP
jgi:nitrogen-specific signal transduction histidine kinase